MIVFEEFTLQNEEGKPLGPILINLGNVDAILPEADGCTIVHGTNQTLICDSYDSVKSLLL